MKGVLVMEFEELIEYLNLKIAPFSLSDEGKKNIANMYNKYPTNLIIESVDIGVKQYLAYDENNNPTKVSIGTFLDKLGGILYNKSKSPIEQELLHVQGLAQKRFQYWDKKRSSELLHDYIDALRTVHWSEEQILEDIQNDVIRITSRARNWTE